ncbi:phosphatidylglycerophosphatase A [Sporolactobacillus terrae]|uniref:Phosphatidylglycerophosphatase A n=1 Tax=Sporolactobacillus terrae TaxID=269673 RepID=A0ABX5Q6E9_9BACL|nr:phosphatidylglycerophosphatase A [Sporolactobacillus terrae]QAA22184.1 phosphatidylglycerophosphatase A [Sporolactobacillus terrae]QAA25157.1 phosphatidylglycerophosphatase A [Sporolactobacillus terrae]
MEDQSFSKSMTYAPGLPEGATFYSAHKKRVTSEAVERAAEKALAERGVRIDDIAEIVFDLQKPFMSGLTKALCVENVKAVLAKRELQHAILVGIELDRFAEKKMLSEPLQSLVDQDEGLFGVDETIALGAVSSFGSIAATTFGYLDKVKPKIIGKVDLAKGGRVNTFLDDLIASIAADASSRLAHRVRDDEEKRAAQSHRK